MEQRRIAVTVTSKRRIKCLQSKLHAVTVTFTARKYADGHLGEVWWSFTPFGRFLSALKLRSSSITPACSSGNYIPFRILLRRSDDFVEVRLQGTLANPSMRPSHDTIAVAQPKHVLTASEPKVYPKDVHPTRLQVIPSRTDFARSHAANWSPPVPVTSELEAIRRLKVWAPNMRITRGC